jgi:hypothetical protein
MFGSRQTFSLPVSSQSPDDVVRTASPCLPIPTQAFSPFFHFAVIMTPLANTPYIFPNLADNWQLCASQQAYAAGVLDWPPPSVARELNHALSQA